MPRKKEEKTRQNVKEKKKKTDTNSDLIPVNIKSIFLHPVQKIPVLFVVDEKEEIVIPMTINFLEAQAILASWQNILFPRPLTADLLFRVIIDHFEAKIKKIIVYDIKDNSFLSDLYIETKEGEEKIIDSRPSDSFALAIKSHAPIYITEKLYKITKKDTENAKAMLEFLEKESQDFKDNIIKF